MESDIFKAYDIRGIYHQDFEADDVVKIAQTYLQIAARKANKKISDLYLFLGRDIRVASEELADITRKVFLEYGVTLDDGGLLSVNDFYFAMGTYHYDGGMMVTASHNPSKYGGFKMTFYDESEGITFLNGKELYQVLQTVSFPLDAEKTAGKLVEKNIFSEHLKHVLSFVDVSKIKPLKVAVDTGNGMTALMVPEIFKQLPCELVPLFFELDGNFPNRPPNPLAEHATEKITAKIKETQADFGMMFDVDGDRFFLVDENGELVRGDMTLILLAKGMLAKYPQAGIVYNLICSHAVKELVKAWGGHTVRSEVGYFNAARHMRESGAIMSGELSSHFAFRDNFCTDNAFIAMLLALEAISVDGRKLSAIIKDFSLYIKGDEINLTTADIPAALEKIRVKYKANILDELDGITVEFSDWWCNVRASNTEPLLRIVVEAKTYELWEEKKTELLTLLS
ncbi:MAG: Phosphomannomutase [Parcubacteria group bacterium GW2011_GWA2_36_10]|nr:MAG: Phosphomannomutase [Parcubacteria group bacterium GW2011_GWA2_36_10]